MTSIPNLGNLGQKQGKNMGHLGPQPTKMEQMAYELSVHCDQKTMSLARQIRAICILLKIKEEDFVKAFENDEAHKTYVLNTIKVQQKLADEKKVQAEKEKLQPVQAVQDEQTKKV